MCDACREKDEQIDALYVEVKDLCVEVKAWKARALTAEAWLAKEAKPEKSPEASVWKTILWPSEREKP